MPLNHMDKYRDPDLVEALVRRIADASARLKRGVRFMEVCGGHTMAIHRFGIPSLLPPGIELVSGPGCPVCVTPASYIDSAIEWGEETDGIVATFGDLYRVPGSAGSLEDAAAEGMDVRVVYSPSDALKMAEGTPDREVLFLAVGFETTAPAVAATIETAAGRGNTRFRVMSAHKTMPLALRVLVEAKDVVLDGFILPGHVSTIIGVDPYRFLADDCRVPCCISGFEPVDILQCILSLVTQCVRETPVVDNRYGRSVRRSGNPKARLAMDRVFRAVDSQWRGIGCIKGSGLDVRGRYAAWAAPGPDPCAESQDEEVCRCGDVLRGIVKPAECPLFGGGCTPQDPVGPCMVSSEGACAAAFKYRDADRFV